MRGRSLLFFRKGREVLRHTGALRRARQTRDRKLVSLEELFDWFSSFHLHPATHPVHKELDDRAEGASFFNQHLASVENFS